MSLNQITILKFGSSVLRSEADLPRAVHEIYRHVRAGEKVLAVVSALGDTTDRLLRQAEALSGNPHPAPLAALLATGETTAAALLSLALDRAGIPAVVLDPAQAGLRTRGPVLDAEPSGTLDYTAIHRAFSAHAVAVLPGFTGRDALGATTLLGRGGSDFTALYLAQQLYAHKCILLKDVEGLYECDPSGPGRGARPPARYLSVSWESALAAGGGVVQPKAIQFAKRHGLSFSISAPGSANETVVGPGPDRLTPSEPPALPLRVALLGHGTVGGGVFRLLRSLDESFLVAGVAVRDVEKALAGGVPAELLSRDAGEIAALDCDVVVELIGGIEPARTLIRSALQAGRDVVTANKALLAAHGPELAGLARRRGARLLFSASVGGAVPALEAARRAAQSGAVRGVEGVLNGTCNFVLDQIAEGLDPASAVRLAQAEGFAEADPTLDLDGSDSAHKLILLARAAFGAELKFSAIRRTGIDRLDPARVRAARAAGKAVRLVASCRKNGTGFTARVEPVDLPLSHPLAQARGAENRVLIESALGARCYSGQGAGRWPTAEAVLADLFDVVRDRRQSGEADVELSEGVAS
jgi:homoserine dehydrogenase